MRTTNECVFAYKLCWLPIGWHLAAHNTHIHIQWKFIHKFIQKVFEHICEEEISHTHRPYRWEMGTNKPNGESIENENRKNRFDVIREDQLLSQQLMLIAIIVYTRRITTTTTATATFNCMFAYRFDAYGFRFNRDRMWHLNRTTHGQKKSTNEKRTQVAYSIECSIHVYDVRMFRTVCFHLFPFNVYVSFLMGNLSRKLNPIWMHHTNNKHTHTQMILGKIIFSRRWHKLMLSVRDRLDEFNGKQATTTSTTSILSIHHIQYV